VKVSEREADDISSFIATFYKRCNAGIKDY
jgi:hypothetical protein